jgi:hypothetical protein
MMRRLVSSILVMSLVPACSGGASAQKQNGTLAPGDDCPAFVIDQGDWRSRANFSVGTEIVMPPSYEMMIWERRTDSSTRVVEFRRHTPPLSSVRLFEVSHDSAQKLGPSPIASAIRCTVQTRSGPASVVINGYNWPERQRATRPAFEVVIALRTQDSMRTVVMLASTMDSSGMKEQLAMARSLRLIRAP